MEKTIVITIWGVVGLEAIVKLWHSEWNEVGDCCLLRPAFLLPHAAQARRGTASRAEPHDHEVDRLSLSTT